MKNNIIKSFVFILILLGLIEGLTWLLLPGFNIEKFGTFNVAAYEILGEEKDTIEAVAVGDSLVYSSLSPMEIWNEFGYTTFDCAEAAQIIEDSYAHVEAAIESQHPKIIFMEANIILRDPKKMKWDNKVANKLKKFVPIAKYHDNWKNYITKGTKENWINVNKGYKYITKIVPSEPKNYMKYSNKTREIPEGNLDYFEKIVNKCNDNNVKLVLVSFPTQNAWGYRKHNTIQNVADEYNLEFIDLNLIDLGIDWHVDTKDDGSHLNYTGAKKVSHFIGNYLKETGLLTDHRNDKDYESWKKAYKIYAKNLTNND